MKSAPCLAEMQIEIVHYVESLTSMNILFCPTYYSLDPILDRVFGARPDRYLEDLGENLSSSIHIMWTGSKVIPSEINRKELEDLQLVIKRKPLIWENVFANDGPKNCYFLRLEPFEGRLADVYQASTGWAFNPMNQVYLSLIAVSAAMEMLRNGGDSKNLLLKKIRELTDERFYFVITPLLELFSRKGLKSLSPTEIEKYLGDLAGNEIYHRELKQWLSGDFIVDSDCLTD